MKHALRCMPQVRWCLPLMAFLMIGAIRSPCLEAAGMHKIQGSVWYRERILPPPDAVVSVTLEDVAKMDVASELIAAVSFRPQGGPPWNFALKYDPGQLHDKGRYALRARIEAGGRLLFTSTEHIPAFNRDPDQAVEILVHKVGGKSQKDAAPPPKPDASLTDTYWKLTALGSDPAELGAGEKEVYLILTAEDQRVKGFSGCNNFTGSFSAGERDITFSQMAATMMACLKGMEQEQRFLQALEAAARFSIEGDSLFLSNADGDFLLRFTAVYLH